MKISVKYFGLISDFSKKDEEIIDVNDAMELDEFIRMLKEKYDMQHEKSFRVALNRNIIEKNEYLKENDEIALLPAFSGG